MSLKENNYREIVRELNIELYEKFRIPELFEYSTTGFDDIIKFDNAIIWSSDMEQREWIEENNDYEPFIPFIKLIFNKHIQKLSLLKLLEK